MWAKMRTIENGDVEFSLLQDARGKQRATEACERKKGKIEKEWWHNMTQDA